MPSSDRFAGRVVAISVSLAVALGVMGGARADAVSDALLRAVSERYEAEKAWRVAYADLEAHRAEGPWPEPLVTTGIALATAGITIGGSLLRLATVPAEVSLAVFAPELLHSVIVLETTGADGPLIETVTYNVILPQVGGAKMAADFAMGALARDRAYRARDAARERVLRAAAEAALDRLERAGVDAEMIGDEYVQERYRMERAEREAFLESQRNWWGNWALSQAARGAMTRADERRSGADQGRTATGASTPEPDRPVKVPPPPPPVPPQPPMQPVSRPLD
ncbi:hypothetical protein [Jannaschia pohangensis]|uniref:Uncharacterized protein n=1 Tax=Jannaschia pohangensis TaxID=390807 RepID=A0A1I3ICI2_9RHOB|nr:hypothetical protein [Jannaschia pohangensis]SFI45580.1 hypothetical protein SAMN04488095_0905 [Jannaschia pohangensis]